MTFKCYATDGATVLKMDKSYVATKKWEDAQHANTQEVVDKNPAQYPDAEEDFALKKKPEGHKGYTRTSPKGKVEQIKEKPYAKKPVEGEKPKVSPELAKLAESFVTGIKEGKPGHLSLVVDAKPELKGLMGQFQAAIDIDAKLSTLSLEVDRLRSEKRDIGDKLSPLFDTLGSYKLGIHTKDSILFLKKIVAEKPQYKELYVEAYTRLNDAAKLELRKLEDTMKTISTSYRTELKKAGGDDIDTLVADAMSHLENLIANREAMLALFHGELPEDNKEIPEGE